MSRVFALPVVLALLFVAALQIGCKGGSPAGSLPMHTEGASTSPKTEVQLEAKTEATPVQDGPAKDDPSTYMMYSKGFIIGMGGDAQHHTELDHPSVPTSLRQV
jgi:hypothetical protein